MTEQINVFHLEDYKIMRDGIRFLLSQDPEINVVGEAKQGEELIEMLPKLEVHVLLLDLYLDAMEGNKTMDGFAICEYVSTHFPHIRIVAHSVYDDVDRIARLMNMGAMGYVSKKAGFEELITAVKYAAEGRKYISKETSKKLKNMTEFLEGFSDTLRGEKDFFSKRERGVLELLGRGFSTKDIARELFITEKTVETHRKNMVDKAKVKNTAELVAFAAARGFLKH